MVRAVYTNLHVTELFTTYSEARRDFERQRMEGMDIAQKDGDGYRLTILSAPGSTEMHGMLIETPCDEDTLPTMLELTDEETAYLDDMEGEPMYILPTYMEGDGATDLCIYRFKDKTLVVPQGEERNADPWAYNGEPPNDEIVEAYRQTVLFIGS